MTANELTKAILLAVAERFPSQVRLWRNNRLVARVPMRRGGTRIVSAGVDGQADLSGIIIGGIRLEVEIKAGRDQQNPAQENFQAMIENLGGIYIVARDVETCMSFIAFHVYHLHVYHLQRGHPAPARRLPNRLP